MSQTLDQASETTSPAVHQEADTTRRLLPPSLEPSFAVERDSVQTGEPAPDRSQQQPSKRRQRALLCWGSCLLLLLIALIRHYYAGVCEAVFAFFAAVAQLPEPLRTTLFWLSSFAVQMASIPIACIVTVVISYCNASYWGGYALSLSVCLAVNLLMLQLLLRKRRGELLASDEQPAGDARAFPDFLAKTVQAAMQRHPYLACGLVRSLHLPDGAKAYILTRFRLKRLQLLLPMLVVESLNVFLYSFVGHQIKDRFDLINPKTFRNKSLAQKISTVSVYALLLLQTAVLVAGLLLTYCKFREYRKTLQQLPASQPVLGLSAAR